MFQETLESLKKSAHKRKEKIKMKMPAKKSKPDPTHVKEDECVYVTEKKIKFHEQDEETKLSSTGN